MTEQQRENVLNASCVTQIQKAIVDQLGSRLSNSDHDLFLVQVWLILVGSAHAFMDSYWAVTTCIFDDCGGRKVKADCTGFENQDILLVPMGSL